MSSIAVILPVNAIAAKKLYYIRLRRGFVVQLVGFEERGNFDF